VNGQSVTTPFPGNIIPTTRLSPISLKIQDLIPVPTLNQSLLNWQQTCVSPEHRDLPAFKIDENFGAKSKLSFYWSEYDYEALGRPDCLPQPISVVTTRSIPTHTYRLTYDYTVTPTFLVHLGAGYVHYFTNAFPFSQVNNYDSVSQLGLKGANGPGFPAMSFGSSTYGGRAYPSAAPTAAPTPSPINRPPSRPAPWCAAITPTRPARSSVSTPGPTRPRPIFRAPGTSAPTRRRFPTWRPHPPAAALSDTDTPASCWAWRIPLP